MSGIRSERNDNVPSRQPFSVWLTKSLAGLLFILIFLAIAGGFWLVRNLPEIAEREFGPAKSGLSDYQRLIYAVKLLYYEEELIVAPQVEGDEIPFNIASGETVDSFSQRMQQQHIISQAEAFKTYLQYSGLDISVQAGEYHIKPGMNSIEVARLLQDATPQEIEFPILPGWRLEEIAQSLEISGLTIGKDDFLSAALHPASSGVNLPASISSMNTMEGFLMPGVYTVNRDITLQQLLEKILTNFDEQISPEYHLAYSQHGLDIYQAVILASIIQREAVVDEEKPMIASVFFNRLATGMKLESDPTVQYALGMTETGNWWKNPLYLSDLESASPYNTYLYAGFPPGPICNPDQSSMRAVAYPQETTYLYFRASCDESGTHHFSNTYEEHVLHACSDEE